MLNDEILHRWINGTITPEELEVFRKRPEYNSLSRLYETTEGLRSPGFNSEAMLGEILQQPKVSQKLAVPSRRRFLGSWASYAAAAVMLIVAAWWFWPLEQVQYYEVVKGEQLKETLPDGSSFVLNAESDLSYRKEDWSNQRTLRLRGEAFFEVENGSTFTVATPIGQVQVLGTSFNVFARNGLFEVTCYTGKVAVSVSGISEVVNLEPGQTVRLTKDNTFERSEITKNQPDWTSGVSSFRNVPLQVVLEEIQRQFDLEIDTTKIQTSKIITASFPHDDLEQALRIVLAPVNIKYEIVDEKNVRLLPE